mmetsp:Transcript_66606/g.184427  ORF Transcript_66606/g.184427 Transcript_66606/m.184427 type:complete len:269 (-) Transcript_66606:954-1760(-)
MLLDGDCHSSLELPGLRGTPTCQAPAHEALSRGGSLVQLAEAPAREHADNAPLDGDRRRVAPENAAHEETAAVPLYGARVAVHLQAPHVVGAPVRLDHRRADPGDGHPLGVFLAILVPGPPDPLDPLGRQLLRPRGLPSRHLRVALLLQLLLNAITVRCAVEDASPANHSRCPCGALHRAVRPEVIRHRLHGRAIHVCLNDLHERLGVVVQGPLHSGLYETPRRRLCLEAKVPHVVCLRHLLEVQVPQVSIGQGRKRLTPWRVQVCGL